MKSPISKAYKNQKASTPPAPSRAWNVKERQYFEKQMKVLRQKIDRADLELLRAFARRFKAVREIGNLKSRFDFPVVQKARWKKVLANRKARAKTLKISPEFIEQVYLLIHKEAVQIQKTKNRKAAK